MSMVIKYSQIVCNFCIKTIVCHIAVKEISIIIIPSNIMPQQLVPRKLKEVPPF